MKSRELENHVGLRGNRGLAENRVGPNNAWTPIAMAEIAGGKARRREEIAWAGENKFRKSHWAAKIAWALVVCVGPGGKSRGPQKMRGLSVGLGEVAWAPGEICGEAAPGKSRGPPAENVRGPPGKSRGPQGKSRCNRGPPGGEMLRGPQGKSRGGPVGPRELGGKSRGPRERSVGPQGKIAWAPRGVGPRETW